MALAFVNNENEIDKLLVRINGHTKSIHCLMITDEYRKLQNLVEQKKLLNYIDSFSGEDSSDYYIPGSMMTCTCENILVQLICKRLQIKENYDRIDNNENFVQSSWLQQVSNQFEDSWTDSSVSIGSSAICGSCGGTWNKDLNSTEENISLDGFDFCSTDCANIYFSLDSEPTDLEYEELPWQNI